jgi:hypothetical protein
MLPDCTGAIFPLLSGGQIGTHYPVWLLKCEYFDGLGARLASGPFLWPQRLTRGI